MPVIAARVILRNSSDGIAARAEREHEERVARRERQLALERRLDSYRSRVWTPSGRPYEDLPTIGLGELRKVLATGNRRNLVSSAAFEGGLNGL